MAIPVVFGIGVVTAVINDPDQTGERSASGVVTETTLPAVIEKPAPVASTTTTLPAPVVVTPTTAVVAPPPPAPVTTTTIRKVVAPSAPVSRPAPRPATPTTQAPAPAQPAQVAIDCGTGTASARSYFEQTATGYQLGAKVINDSTKTIELDSLIVRATYADGNVKTFVVDVKGKQVAARPGTAEMAFPIPDSAGPTPPQSFEISEFKFHTAGLPECASQ